MLLLGLGNGERIISCKKNAADMGGGGNHTALARRGSGQVTLPTKGFGGPGQITLPTYA